LDQSSVKRGHTAGRNRHENHMLKPVVANQMNPHRERNRDLRPKPVSKSAMPVHNMRDRPYKHLLFDC